MAEENKPGQVSEPSSKKNPLLMILMVVNILAMGAVAFFQWRFMEMEAKRPDLTQLLKEKMPERQMHRERPKVSRKLMKL